MFRYSISARDVFKALAGPVDYFIELQWADRKAAEMRLVPPLVDMLTSCVRYYGEQVGLRVLRTPTRARAHTRRAHMCV